MLLGAWTCAGWSAVAVPAVAVTRHTQVIVCWALGVLAMLVLLIVIWTEQRPAADPREPDEPLRTGPPTPHSDGTPTTIDWDRLEQEVLALPPNSP
jgi:hypothetical protein